MSESSNTEKVKIHIIDQENQFLDNNTGWSVPRIKYELEVRGISLASLSRNSGYSETAAGRALRTPWPALETIIADALGQGPETIRPDRYINGVPRSYAKPRRGRPRKSEVSKK